MYLSEIAGMKYTLFAIAIVATSLAVANCQTHNNKECSGGWVKYSGNPVLGGDYGTCYDMCVLKDGGVYLMWFSWRSRASIGLVKSEDGLHWSKPVVVLTHNEANGWEKDINRPIVIKRNGIYHMWYTGQDIYLGEPGGRSAIGYATSTDGVAWKRMSEKPVLSPEKPWEKVAVMCPHVMWDEEAKLYKMWYSAGGQREPDAFGYATSPDGMAWTKYVDNPILERDPTLKWMRNRVAGAQVIKEGGWYLMFYCGFSDPYRAQVGVVRSKDGIKDWQQLAANPIIQSSARPQWDSESCYKPFALFDGKKWLLWYNGRRAYVEQIGVAIHEGRDLGPWGAFLSRPKPLLYQASASHCFPGDTLEALEDGLEPTDSNDHEIPRFTWWDHRGTTEWVQYDFPKPKEVSSVSVYWFHERDGDCKLPASWRLFYREGEEWKEISGPAPDPPARDQWNSLTFAPVTTTALRIDAQLRPGSSGGILEWKVK